MELIFYQNTTYNRITLKIAQGYGLSFGTGMSKVLGGDADKYYTSDGNLPNVPQLENVTSVQVHCSMVYKEYENESSLLYEFTPDNSFGLLLPITARVLQWCSTRKSTHDVVVVWLTDQDGKELPLEDNWSVILQIASREFIKF